MTTSWAEVMAERRGVTYEPTVLYSVCGTGVDMNTGYPHDLCQALVDAGLPFIHQPVGYPAAPFPMQDSINDGDAELARLMTSAWNGKWYMPDLDAILVGYSQGAIVTSNVFDTYRAGKLTGFNRRIVAGVTWGNPRRQEGHTIPGGIDNGGMGVVTPNLVNTPQWWWDFASDKAMVNSAGDDFYTKKGKGENTAAAADEEAVWDIIATKNPKNLAEAVFHLMAHPSFNGTIGAAEAAFKALGFFGGQCLPHTTYQIVQPIAGDDRDCWRVAYDYLYQVGTNGPMLDTTKGTIMTEPEPVPAEAAISPLADLDTFKAEAEKFIAEAQGIDAFLEKYAGILPIPGNVKADLAELSKGLGFAATVLNAI